MSRILPGYLVAITLFLGLLPASASAAKTDVVVLVNGNAVTGEVKSLEFGSLRYSTDSMGTVSIDWEDILSVSSEQDLQIELSDGTRYYGKLLPAGEPHHVRVVTASEAPACCISLRRKSSVLRAVAALVSSAVTCHSRG